ncbi:hypothetical protein DPMN_141548, partial [Dreissena polymorpha]
DSDEDTDDDNDDVYDYVLHANRYKDAQGNTRGYQDFAQYKNTYYVTLEPEKGSKNVDEINANKSENV